MNYTLHTSIVDNALEMAKKRRNPPKGLIYHTDRRNHEVKWNPER